MTGRDGHKICSDTRHGVGAYQGVAVENMPNFAMLYGPNTNLSHVSVMLMIEAQARYISAMIDVVLKNMRRDSILTICPKLESIVRYNEDLQARLGKTVFTTTGCKSWYRAANGVVTNNWPGTAKEYQENLSVLNWDDYDLSGPDINILKQGVTQNLGGAIESQPASFSGICAWIASTASNLLRMLKTLSLGAKAWLTYKG